MQPRAIPRSLCRDEEFVGGVPIFMGVYHSLFVVLVWLGKVKFECGGVLVVSHLDLSLTGLDRAFGGDAVMTGSICLQYLGGKAVNLNQQ